MKDDCLEASESLPDPDVITRDIAEDLHGALAQFEEIAADLSRIQQFARVAGPRDTDMAPWR